MRILCFDTETTGLPAKNGKKRAVKTDLRHPWAIQIAGAIYDGPYECLSEFNFLVRPPEGVVIGEDATKIHGISMEDIENGDPLTQDQMMDMLIAALPNVDYVVGYNVPFDIDLVEFSAARLRPDEYGKLHESIFGDMPRICVMRGVTDLVKKGPIAYGKYRWPKLGYAYQKLLGKELVGAHDALVDVRATMELFAYLYELEEKKTEQEGS